MSSPNTSADRQIPRGNGWIPETEAEKAAVREQLDRLLGSPLFKNSKRYPALLHYVVERVLAGHLDHLKERNLGVEVFHREVNYDTNQDPVVRTTAVEVRKRLAQYYQEPGHENEIRIEFPAGSYTPEFRMPPVAAPAPLPPPAKRRALFNRWTVSGIAVVVIAGSTLLWWSPWKKPDALEAFWNPVWNSSDRVLVCVGGDLDSDTSQQLPAKPEASPGFLGIQKGANDKVPLGELFAVARIMTQKTATGKRFRLRSHENTRFEDLREGPVILIGGFENYWTVRLLNQMRVRFRLEHDAAGAWISDQTKPGSKMWVAGSSEQSANATDEYALVTRVWDTSTGQVIVSAAGLAPSGTAAAGEFLSQAGLLKEALGNEIRTWQSKNVQVVIAARLSGSTGAPRVLATHVW